MKRLLLSAMTLLPFVALAQKPYTIKGNVKNLKTGDKIYLVYAQNGQPKTDSTKVTNGTFELKGVITDPSFANLFKNINPYVIKGANPRTLDYTSLYIEPGNIVLSSVDSIKSAKISGTPTNHDNTKLNAELKPLTDQLTAINEEFGKLTPDQQKDKATVMALRERYEKAMEGMNPIYLNFAKNNLKSYISLVSLSQMAGNPDLLAKVEPVFGSLSTELKATSIGKALAASLETGKKTAIGVMAMDFTQNDTEGKPVKLSDFKGKYVLVDFWASWCGPCRRENPNVVAAYNKFKDKGFTVLGVSLDDETKGGKAAWLKAIADDKLSWTQVSDLLGWKNKVAQQYDINSIPANFLIDPTGKIIAKGLREEALQAKLEELLGNKSK